MSERWCPETERECFLRPIIYGPRRWEFLEDKTCWHCQNLYKNDKALFEARKKMLEKEEIVPRVEQTQLNQSEFLAELERARLHWVGELERAVEQIRGIDKQRLGVDQALSDNQIVRYFREDSFDEKGEKISSRLYFRPEPKGELGFYTDEGNKTK